MVKSILCALLLSLFTISLIYGQIGSQTELSYKIDGYVLDRINKSPISGVNIQSKRLASSVQTDHRGFFTILVSSPIDTLILKHIGFENYLLPITSSSKKPLEALLTTSSKVLDEVLINTGYQQLKPNETTGAIQVLDEKALNQQIGTNILERLNNISTAVRFDNEPIQNTDLQKTNISVRGMSTINGMLDPLIVLDGFIYEGNINNIDPNNIESISILKDAAATSIWGARAGNGVIVISTKKAKAGVNNEISFNSTFTLKQKPALFDLYQPNTSDFIAVEQMLFKSGYYTRQLQRTPYLAITPATEILYQRSLNTISSEDSLRLMQELIASDLKESYTKEFLIQPIIQQYGVGIRGNSALNSYNLGFGYTNDKNAYANYSNKMHITAGNSYKPFKNLQLDLSFIFTDQTVNSGRLPYESFTYGGKRVPYGSFRDLDGNGLPFYNSYRKEFIDSYLSDYLLDWKYYPTEDYKHSTINTRLNEFYPNLRIGFKVLPFLNLQVAGQYQYQKIDNNRLHTQESYAARLMINQFSQVNQQTGVVTYKVPLGGIRSSEKNEVSSYTLRAQADVDKQWGNYRLLGIVGAEIRESQSNGETFTAYGYTDNPLKSIPVDFVSYFPILPTNSSSTISGVPFFSKTINRFSSLYSNFSLLYKEKYGLSASVRRDGANIFGADTNDKWTPFWSSGLFWDITNESFKPSVFQQLKIRATYGVSGNVDLRKTALPIANPTTGLYTNYPALVIGSLNDPSLRWEKISTLNFGVDWSLLNNRLTGNLDYYIKNGNDLYGLDIYDYTLWGVDGTIVKNTASMLSKGVELNLNSINTTGIVQWGTSLLFSHNRNKTTKYYSRYGSNISTLLTDGNTITPIVGSPLYSLAAYRWAGLDDKGNPIGYYQGEESTNYNDIRLEASSANASNIVYLGSAKPQYFGALINRFDYKQFSLSVNISYKAGYKVRKPVTRSSNLYTRGIAYPDFEKRWQNPGDEYLTNVPSLLYPINEYRDTFYAMSEINVLNGSHVRLEYINLSYRPKLKSFSNRGFLELFANANNLGLLWTANDEGFDPEYKYNLKPQRGFGFGFRANF
ncbi:SusC/RagA family TonB-linked outer membrane protein [Sphingobacterium rhinopitheci]|uniref:SusC/RagA family TonB-linked outer membrane protein n=1 Tax=Sphingobacterium rhinopitheci TaxID=2781960 RepID=UPI001F5161CA|nr:SusC/RagA family TonB-linked outer membrane protein [Sphingobacterium rhinopitheci]MCI0922404.1 SusC/RagA family TonB-linked outer membrane protein [Sphingobacterium rhinopitheci]